ncbi:unnamed protein product [Aphanomyces euteiches]|uniref:Uncharacterized protein n=1 Tax=Aphanomyces euteiches TaxID=100861 RepID=A0A6G0WWA9_9STRA|nr:hypothetical protein Ae201684_011066 [Aphanomyces euteiches]KAH9058698.1 hypothetical protein Ae201684P_006039 [Aphanomyces euteiches]KAH9132855.1 hypothetical protein AeRB84_020919 [Aphanomyces euteiches]
MGLSSTFVRWMTLGAVLSVVSSESSEGKFIAVSPNDPFVQSTATAFVQDYQTKLNFHFATIETNRIVTAEIATHNVTLDDIQFEPETGLAAAIPDVPSTGYTYRVNLLLALHFNSKHFGGTSYHTVASADYTCKNDTILGENCEAQSFLQNERQVHAVDAVPSFLLDVLNQTLYHNIPVRFTAYETQLLTTHSKGKMHFAAFTIHDEPVQCSASIYHDGVEAHVLHYNTDCLTTEYDDSILWNASTRTGTWKAWGVGGIIVTVLAVIGVVVGRRSKSTASPPHRYNKIRFENHPSQSPRRVQEVKFEAPPPKSYSSMAV